MDEPERASKKPRRRRSGLAAFMGFLVVFALGTTFCVPLVRPGSPPCLSGPAVVRWLLKNPGTASCTDCHGGAWSRGMPDVTRVSAGSAR